MNAELELRERIALHGQSLFNRSYTCGSSGNISVRLPDGILVTPTNSCLGRLDPERISKLTFEGELVSGDKPSKEAFLHLSMYRSRPDEHAIVHLHSTYSVAVSCLEDTPAADALPPITAYYIMRVGKLPMLPYYAPGDPELAAAVEESSKTARALLLANHGPVVAGKDLDAAVYATEELEETARLHLMLRGERTRFLQPDQIAELKRRYG